MKKFCFLFINSLFLVSGILASETDYTKGQYIRFHYAIGKSEYVLELQPDGRPLVDYSYLGILWLYKGFEFFERDRIWTDQK